MLLMRMRRRLKVSHGHWIGRKKFIEDGCNDFVTPDIAVRCLNIAQLHTARRQMTEDEKTARTLNDGDLEGFANRVANHAIQDAEIANKAAVYCGHLFREHIVTSALAMLKTVVQHERMMAKQ